MERLSRGQERAKGLGKGSAATFERAESGSVMVLLRGLIKGKLGRVRKRVDIIKKLLFQSSNPLIRTYVCRCRITALLSIPFTER
jgi:hypothetical protein